MATVSQFLDYVQLYAPDVSEGVAQFVIQEAVTDFMLKTEIARDFIRIPLHDNVHDYAIELDGCRILSSIKSVKRLSDNCDEMGTELVNTKTPDTYGYAFDTDNGAMDAIWIGEVCEGEVVEVEYAWAIGRGGCDIPDFILNKYAAQIQFLALSKLYLIPGQEWTNPQIASGYQAQYERAVTEIKRKTTKVQGGQMIGGGFIRRKHDCVGGFFRR